MKINDFVKIGTFAAVFLGASATLSAFPGSKAKKQNMPVENPCKGVEVEKPSMLEVTGTVTVIGSEEAQVITLLTEDNKAYVLSSMDFKRPAMMDGERTENAVKSDRAAKADKKMPPMPPKGDNKNAKAPGDGKEPKEIIKTEDIVALNGKKATVKGFLNNRNNVFTVLEIVK